MNATIPPFGTSVLHPLDPVPLMLIAASLQRLFLNRSKCQLYCVLGLLLVAEAWAGAGSGAGSGTAAARAGEEKRARTAVKCVV